MRLLVALLILLSVTPVSPCAADRPSVAVLPFGVAGNKGNLRWMGSGLAATLSDMLARQPGVRGLAYNTVLARLRSAGARPDNVAWSSTVASRSLGRWLDADFLVVGAVGPGRHRSAASQLLGISRSQKTTSRAEIWIAARLERVDNGEIVGRAFQEGKRSDAHHGSRRAAEDKTDHSAGWRSNRRADGTRVAKGPVPARESCAPRPGACRASYPSCIVPYTAQ